MYVQKIKIINFKSIYEPIELDFSEVTGFWRISGNIGTGKTTIGEAILFGLFGTINGKNNNDLISWGQKHACVEIWCESKNKQIYIKRELNSYGQSPIYVEVEGQELTFTNKRDAQSQLEKEYYDISRTTAELLCIISFNNFRSLATLNTKDSRQFLDQVLGFYVLTKYSENIKKITNEISDQIKILKNNINILTGQYDHIYESINQVVSEVDLNEDEILNKLNDLKAQLIELDTNWTKKSSDIQKLIQENTSKKSFIETRGKSVNKEIKFISMGTCPTCGASIDKSHLLEKQQERQEWVDKYKDVTKILSELDDKYKEERNNYKHNRDSLINKKSEIEVLLARINANKNRTKYDLDSLEKIKQEIEEKQQQLSAHQSEENGWELLLDIISNKARIKILNSFIPVLNNNIQQYSHYLGLPYTVKFDQNFKCSISLLINPDIDISISSLSTGQLKIVDMVIILGVLGSIINSSELNIIFLDELFSNLDKDMRQIMCSLLKNNLKPNTSMFIISHTNMDEQWFDGDIHLSLHNPVPGEYHTKMDINHKNL